MARECALTRIALRRLAVVLRPPVPYLGTGREFDGVDAAQQRVRAWVGNREVGVLFVSGRAHSIPPSALPWFEALLPHDSAFLVGVESPRHADF